MKIRRAIVSVSEKMGVVDFAKALSEMGVEILSTGGTGRLLAENGVDIKPIEDFTGVPEMLDGRLKTLHPKIHGGILNVRDDADHAKQKEQHGIEDIDLVVVNLYPFEAAVAKPEVTLDEAIENIDIGGPAMIRSAAKNWKYVTVVVDHGDYSRLLDEMQHNDGATTDALRFELSRKVFAHTARYDSMIASWLEEHDSQEKEIEGFPQVLRMELSKAMNLRYGENPHQRAALYVRRHADEASASAARKLSGLDLSFNNLLDATAAFELVKELDEPGVAVVKHTNPCGAAVSECVADAYAAAYAGDPNGAYGSAVGLNRRVDAKIAMEMARPDRLVEVIIAPAFDKDAVGILVNNTDWGKKVRLLAAGDIGRRDKKEFDIRAITGGFLRQDRDLRLDGPGDQHVVTERKPDERQLAELKFAATVCKHVKSNAIVVAKDRAVVGVGSGQMTHADASLCAIRKAGDRISGSCAASDAFIWFPETLKILAEAGVSAIIQPNGEGQHEHIVKVANELKLALVLTTVRHFSH